MSGCTILIPFSVEQAAVRKWLVQKALKQRHVRNITRFTSDLEEHTSSAWLPPMSDSATEPPVAEIDPAASKLSEAHHLPNVMLQQSEADADASSLVLSQQVNKPATSVEHGDSTAEVFQGALFTDDASIDELSEMLETCLDTSDWLEDRHEHTRGQRKSSWTLSEIQSKGRIESEINHVNDDGSAETSSEVPPKGQLHEYEELADITASSLDVANEVVVASRGSQSHSGGAAFSVKEMRRRVRLPPDLYSVKHVCLFGTLVLS